MFKQFVSESMRGDKVFGKVDKVSRYKWGELKEKGDFQWIDKSLLLVDEDYQRSRLNQSRINKMAAQWSWVLCGALSVALRGKYYYVMDGQHRKLAADKRSDVQELPCVIFTLDSKSEEASSFVSLNSQKTAVAGVDRFRAMIVAEDKSAIGLNNLLLSTGHKVGQTGSKKTVACIICLWKLYRQDEVTFHKLWPLIADISLHHAVIDVLARAMWGCENKLKKEKGTSLTEVPYRPTLINAGAEVLGLTANVLDQNPSFRSKDSKNETRQIKSTS